MRVTIQLRGETDRETLTSHIERRLHFALNRLEDRVTSVTVRCSDINGPKGGLDKRCAIELRGPEVGVLVVEALDSDWRRAVDQAVTLANRALVRALERAVQRGPRAGFAGEVG